MPNVLVDPRRMTSTELAVVGSGFIDALTDYFIYRKDEENERRKGSMSIYYFFVMLQFNTLPTREPTPAELQNLKLLAKTVDGYRKSARDDSATYAKYWNSMASQKRADLMQLNMTKQSPAVRYLLEAFNLKSVLTATPEEFTETGFKNLENINVNSSQSGILDGYGVVAQVWKMKDYDVIKSVKTYSEYIKAEQSFESGQAPETTPDPGDIRTDLTTPPEIKEAPPAEFRR